VDYDIATSLAYGIRWHFDRSQDMSLRQGGLFKNTIEYPTVEFCREIESLFAMFSKPSVFHRRPHCQVEAWPAQLLLRLNLFVCEC
jgi:hypothetical protein